MVSYRTNLQLSGFHISHEISEWYCLNYKLNDNNEMEWIKDLIMSDQYHSICTVAGRVPQRRG
jgi:hypothetical protein